MAFTNISLTKNSSSFTNLCEEDIGQDKSSQRQSIKHEHE